MGTNLMRWDLETGKALQSTPINTNMGTVYRLSVCGDRLIFAGSQGMACSSSFDFRDQRVRPDILQ
jgi:hypothetical protein